MKNLIIISCWKNIHYNFWQLRGQPIGIRLGEWREWSFVRSLVRRGSARLSHLWVKRQIKEMTRMAAFGLSYCGVSSGCLNIVAFHLHQRGYRERASLNNNIKPLCMSWDPSSSAHQSFNHVVNFQSSLWQTTRIKWMRTLLSRTHSSSFNIFIVKYRKKWLQHSLEF